MEVFETYLWLYWNFDPFIVSTLEFGETWEDGTEGDSGFDSEITNCGESPDDAWLEFGDCGGEGDNWADGDEGWEESPEAELKVSAVEEFIHFVDDTTSDPVVT